MSPIGGVPNAQEVRLVVGSAGLTHEPQAADTSPVVRRLRSAAIDSQWHTLLDGVYAHCREVSA